MNCLSPLTDASPSTGNYLFSLRWQFISVLLTFRVDNPPFPDDTTVTLPFIPGCIPFGTAG